MQEEVEMFWWHYYCIMENEIMKYTHASFNGPICPSCGHGDKYWIKEDKYWIKCTECGRFYKCKKTHMTKYETGYE